MGRSLRPGASLEERAIPTRAAVLLLTLAVPLTAAFALPVTSDLDLDGPVSFTLDPRWSIPAYNESQPFMNGAGGVGLLVADLDGDGVHEQIQARRGSIHAHTISVSGGRQNLWWFTLPPEFTWDWPSAALLGTADADADGRLELLAVGQDHSTHHWRLWVLDAVTGDVRFESALLPTSERREDGVWDGAYGLAGALTVPTAAGPRPAYVLYVAAAYDLQPRGVLAVDARDGALLWFLPMAGKPQAQGCRVADLEGDGTAEVLVATVAVENYPDDLAVDGLRDDAVHVCVIEADGRVRWRFSHPAAPGGGGLAPLDLDGDGRLEVLDWTNLGGGGATRITVRDAAEGRELAGLELDSPVLQLIPLAAEGVEPPRLVLARYDVGLERYAWREGLWHLERHVRAPAQLKLREAFDLLPSPGPEFLVGAQPGRLAVLDADLRLLAVTPDAARHGSHVSPLFAQDGSPMIMILPGSDASGVLYALVPAVGSGPSRLLLLTVIPVAAAGAVAVRRRRRGSSEPAFGGREARLQLLGQLELAGHGAIGLLKTLRRVVWLGRAAPAEGAEPWRERMLALGGECRERALPSVDGLLRLADAAELEPRVVMRAKESLALVQKELSNLHIAAYGREALADHLPDLSAAADDLENDLQRLRREVAADFRTDLAATADRVLLLLREELEAGGVAVERLGEPQAWVRCDPEELAFVLDDLVQNALRAMAAAGSGSLTLAWRVDAGALVCDVTDTGVGIVPDDWERVFDVGFSTREGGGLGLSRSRDLLRKYEGALSVHASEPGRGTTMRLRLPYAPPPH